MGFNFKSFWRLAPAAMTALTFLFLGSQVSAQVVSGQNYRLFTACGAQDKVMSISGGSLSNQAQAVLATRNDSSLAQVFRIESVGTAYRLTAVHSSKALEVANNSLSDSAAIWQNDWLNKTNQQFKVVMTSDGYARFQSVSSGKYIDLASANVTDGAKFQQYSSNSTCAQKFKLSAVAETWTRCASEGGVCSFVGTRKVRYGANGAFAYLTASNSIGCNNSVFGDPAYGVTKACDYSSIVLNSTSPTPTPTPTPVATPTPTPTPSSTPPPSSGSISGPIVPVPTNIANGSTVLLQCGTIYQGTLNLAGKSNVTVTTSGTCGKAVITPAKPISGWSLYKGNIYSAAIGFAPAQVSVDGTPLEAAHWPNKPQVWASPGSALPSSDLAGASLVTNENKWTIRAQTLSSNSVSTSVPFYVEGKLWMLDVAGEWAYSGGRLYVWAPNGVSPEGRVWAASQSDYAGSAGVSSGVSDLASLGINANNSSGIIIDSVKVFSASDAISGNNASNLQILNVDVQNSSRDGIFASGSSGLVIKNSIFKNSVRNGIGGWYSSNATVSYNTISVSGMVGMPRPTQGGIFFGYTSKNILIDHNAVSSSGYNGITAHISSTVSNNLVDGACYTLADGGGIYTNGRTSGVPLYLKIDGNTVRNVILDGSKGIYLDDSSSFVTITNNTVSASRTGLFIHDGHDNAVTGNTFFSNINHHVALALTSYNNKFTSNKFQSTRGELTYSLEGSNVTSFGTFDYNTYQSGDTSRFANAGGTKSYSGWKSYMGQDTHSTMNGTP